MDTLTIDFETYYDKDFSLKKMTMREYIMLPQFEIILVSVQVNGSEPVSFSGTKRQTGEWLAEFDWNNSICVAHNAIFDGAILEWHFGIRPKYYFCTMMASRAVEDKTHRMALAALADVNDLSAKGTAVHNALAMRREHFSLPQLQEYTDYCNRDVEICYDLYLRYARKMPAKEKYLLHLTVTKYTRPQLIVDKDIVTERLAIHLLEKEALLERAGLPDRSTLMSNDAFAAALMLFGVDPPRKISPKTGKENWAFAKTDEGMRRLLEHPNSQVVALVEARLGHKSTIEETRLQKFIAVANIGKGELPVPLLYYGAHTGRFSGTGGMNLQNLPSRGQVGPALRTALRAPKGHKVIAGDLSQIEARLVATLAGQMDLITQFANDEDVYKIFSADKLYKKPEDEVTDAERFVGKQAILSLGYCSGAWKFNDTMNNVFGVPFELTEADKVVDTYRKTFTKITKLWNRLSRLIIAMTDEGCNIQLGPVRFLHEKILLPNGMYIRYKNLKKDVDGNWYYDKHGKRNKIYGGAMLENIAQSLARIIISDAEMLLASKGLFACLQIHDELVYVVKEEHAEKVKRAIEIALTKPVKWLPKLPVACEVAIGNNYKEAK